MPELRQKLSERYQLVAAVAVAATGIYVAEPSELAQVALGSGGSETESRMISSVVKASLLATNSRMSTSLSAKAGFIDHLSTISCRKTDLSTIFSVVETCFVFQGY